MWWRSDQTDEMESASSELAKILPTSARRSQKWVGLGSSPLQVFMPLQSKSVCIALSNTIQGNFTLFENEDLSAKAEIVGQMLKNLIFRWDLFSLKQLWIIDYRKISGINFFLTNKFEIKLIYYLVQAWGGQTSTSPGSNYFSEIFSPSHIKLTHDNPNKHFKSVKWP